jgi:hypothetical protein
MRSLGLCLLLFAPLFAVAEEPKWTTLKGTITLHEDSPIPERKEILETRDPEVCCGVFEEHFIVDGKTRAIKNLFVWIEPAAAKKRGEPFPKERIHPDLVKPAEETLLVNVAACQFVPHVLGIREGQNLQVRNIMRIHHNARFSFQNNPEVNVLLKPESKYDVEKLKVEKMPVSLQCSIHPYMQAWIRIFDHPYFAVTDEKGQFEIKLAPQGEFKLYLWQESCGWHKGREGANGTPIEIKGATLDLKQFKFQPQK